MFAPLAGAHLLCSVEDLYGSLPGDSDEDFGPKYPGSWVPELIVRNGVSMS